MATIYRKTDKGIDEIQTRAHRLAPRARNALILVDGQRSDDDLARLVQTEETLALLLSGGFIEPVSQTAAATPMAGAPVPAPARQIDMVLLRRIAVRLLNDQVGPAAEELSMRIERAKDLETLRPLLIAARKMIVNVRGEQAGAEYISKLSAL